MTTWILILTLSTASFGSAIEHIPGFTSKQECLVAGDEWLKSKPYSIGRAICVAQSHTVAKQ